MHQRRLSTACPAELHPFVKMVRWFQTLAGVAFLIRAVSDIPKSDRTAVIVALAVLAKPGDQTERREAAKVLISYLTRHADFCKSPKAQTYHAETIH